MSYNKVTKFGEVRKEKTQTEGVSLPFVVNNFISKEGGELAGDLNLNGNFIKNLPDPVNMQDAATKNYIDSSQGHSFFRRSPGKGYIATQNLNMNEHSLTNLAMPVNNLDASNKLYTDIQTSDVKKNIESQNPFVFANNEYQAKQKINMMGYTLEGIKNPDQPEDIATVGFVNDNIYWVKKNGGIIAKDHVYLGRKKLGGLKEPVSGGEAVPKFFLEKEIEDLKVVIDEKINEVKASALANPDAGNIDEATIDALKAELEKQQPFNTRNGKTYNAKNNLNMRQKKLSNLPEPSDENDASTKAYTDEKDEELKEYIDENIKNLDSGLIRRNGGFLSTDAIDMNTNRIKNLGRATETTDAVTMLYVTEEINKLTQPFIREDGEYRSKEHLNMGRQRITNLKDPIEPHDAVNQVYLDESLNNIKDPVNEHNAVNKRYVDNVTSNLLLPENLLLNILGSSITLIRAEAIGPIVGIDKTHIVGLNQIEKIGFNHKHGYFSDIRGHKLDFTEIYFGKYDGGLYYQDNRDRENLNQQGVTIERTPIFSVPFNSYIFYYSLMVKFKENVRREEEEDIKLVLFEMELDNNNPGDAFKTRDLSFKRQLEFTATVKPKDNLRTFSYACGFIPGFYKVDSCSSFCILFNSSHEHIERFHITLAMYLRFDFDKNNLPFIDDYRHIIN